MMDLRERGPPLRLLKTTVQSPCFHAGVSFGRSKRPVAAKADSATFPEDSVTFVISLDPHYLSPRLSTQGMAYEKASLSKDGGNLSYMDEIIDAFVDEIITENLDAVLLMGRILHPDSKKMYNPAYLLTPIFEHVGIEPSAKRNKPGFSLARQRVSSPQTLTSQRIYASKKTAKLFINLVV